MVDPGEGEVTKGLGIMGGVSRFKPKQPLSNAPAAFQSTHDVMNQRYEKTQFQIQLRVKGPLTTTIIAYPFHSVEFVKHQLIQQLHMTNTRLKDLCVYHKGTELRNRSSLNPFISSGSNVVTMHWDRKVPEMSKGGIQATGGGVTSPEMEDLIVAVRMSLEKGINPKLVEDGTGGTYQLFCRKTRQCLAFFKPSDEEPFAPNNPRGYPGKLGSPGFRTGVMSGEGPIREVAAFVLDLKYESFSGVPLTLNVKAYHERFNYAHDDSEDEVKEPSAANGGANFDTKPLRWKQGSLQACVAHAESCSNYNPNMYSIRDVQGIAILDIRVMNLDRNEGNILVQHIDVYEHGELVRVDATPDKKLSRFRLIPIDHGLILPDVMDVNELDLIWFNWKHVKLPTTEETLLAIFMFEPDKDARRLSRRLDVRKECLRTMRVATRLLQIGSRLRLTLHQIACFMCRTYKNPEKPSELEGLVQYCMNQIFDIIYGTSDSGTTPAGMGILMDLAVASPTASEKSPKAKEALEKQRASSMVGLGEKWGLGDSDKVEGAARQRVDTTGSAAGGILSTSSLDVTEDEESSRRSTDKGSDTTAFNLQTQFVDRVGFRASDLQKSEAERVSVNLQEKASGSKVEVERKIRSSSSEDGEDDEDDNGAVTHSRFARVPLGGRTGEELDSIAETEEEKIGTRHRRPVSSGTRRPTQTAARLTRATATRGSVPLVAPQSSWAFFDRQGRPMPVDWSENNFDKRFFIFFEETLKDYLCKKYPNWETFPYLGHDVERVVSEHFEKQLRLRK